MNAPTKENTASPPWLLILGLLLGAGFIVYMGWSSFRSSKSNANIVELNASNWRQEVVESSVPVLVDFTAAWCAPCQRFAPTVDRLAERYKGKVKVAKFDVGDDFDNMRDFVKTYPHLAVGAIPHMMIFKGGDEKPHFSFNPQMSEQVVARKLDAVLASR
jgi:thioredoxin 1